MATILERHMAGRTFVVGDAVTAADCVTAYLMDWANEQDLIEGKPNLQAYLARMYDRPTAPQRIAEAVASIAPRIEVLQRPSLAIAFSSLGASKSGSRTTRPSASLIAGGFMPSRDRQPPACS